MSGDSMHLFEPGLPLRCAGPENRPEREGFGGLDTAKLRCGFADLVQPRHAIDPAVVPGWRIHGYQQMGAATVQQFVGKGLAFAVLEGEAGQQTRSKKPLSEAGIPPHQIG